jgi:hypothetical protein
MLGINMNIRINKLTGLATSVLTLTSGLAIVTSTSQTVLAQVVSLQSGTFSYQAGDLLAETPINLEEFCKVYRLNSRCADTPTQLLTPQPPQPTIETTQNGPTTSGWGVTPEISTLGVGATITKSITPNLNAKLGVRGLGTSANISESGIDYDAKLNLFSVSTLVDYHPWKNSGFRLTGGLVFQDNNIEGNGKSNSDQKIQIGDQEYTSDQLGSVKAKVSFPNSVAPYLGIGWGNAVKPGNRWSFSANLGVMFTGSPKVNLTPQFGAAATPQIQDQIQSDVERERQQLENDLKWLNIYPVLSLGISYQF